MKKTLLALSLAAAGMMLTACASGMDSTLSTTPPVSPTNTMTASPGMQPEETAGLDGAMGITPTDAASDAASDAAEAAGATSVPDARKAAEAIEDELEKLSEVEDAQVVLIGNTAAVALEFDDQYQGGIDERLRKIVQERVDGVISGVDVIEITADNTLMDELEKLGDRLDDSMDMDKLRTDLEDIIRRITGTRDA